MGLQPMDDFIYLFMGRNYICALEARRRGLSRSRYHCIGSNFELIRGTRGPLVDSHSRYRLVFCPGGGFEVTEHIRNHARAIGFDV